MECEKLAHGVSRSSTEAEYKAFGNQYYQDDLVAVLAEGIVG